MGSSENIYRFNGAAQRPSGLFDSPMDLDQSPQSSSDDLRKVWIHMDPVESVEVLVRNRRNMKKYQQHCDKPWQAMQHSATVGPRKVYPLVIFPLKIVIFNSYVSHYQRVIWAKILSSLAAMVDLRATNCLGCCKSETLLRLAQIVHPQFATTIRNQEILHLWAKNSNVINHGKKKTCMCNVNLLGKSSKIRFVSGR